MATCLVVFASLNQVALLKRSLYRMGVFVEMQRTPHCLSTTGCSFALRCERHELPLLQMKCKEMSIEPGGIFEETRQADGAHYVTLNASELGR
jgi:hypothetical protein